MFEKINPTNKYLAIAQITVILLVLYFTSWYSYLFFHSMVEVFCVIVAVGVFVVGWNSRKFIDNNYFLIVSISFFFVGLFDLLHLFAFEGQTVLKLASVNISSQLWLAARFLAAASLFIAPFYVKRALNYRLVFVIYLLIFLSILTAIVRWHAIPSVYIEGLGTTEFKKYAEYLIFVLYLGATLLLYKKRKSFDVLVYRLLLGSLACMMMTEILLFNRLGVLGWANLLSHLFKTASFYLLYLGIIEIGLMKPYRLLFKNLKDGEKALKQSEERYRSLVEMSPDGMIVHCFGKIVFANSAAVVMMQVKSEADLIGKDIVQFFHPDFRAVIERRIKQFKEGKNESQPKEVQLLTAKGRTMDVEIKGALVTYDGQIAIQTMIRDITTRKLAVDDASDHVVITDEDGKIIYANKAAERMTGYDRNEMIGRRPSLWGNCVGKNFDADVNFCQRPWELIQEGSNSFVGEVVNQRRNGEKYITDLHISPVYDENKEINVYIWIERDITRLKEIDHAKTEFVSLASHQLRTPISSISLSAELLLRDIGGKLEPKQKQYVEEIFEKSKQMSELVDTLLNVSRIELGTFFVQRDSFDLVERMKQIAAPLATEAENKKIIFNERYFTEQLIVNFDRNTLSMIVENLLSNAVYYTPEKGRIIMAVNSKDGEIVISVSDTGSGIPATDQPKVFSKFFRSDSAQLSRQKGTGLGLYIVKSLVEKSNGRVWFDSVEGLGTTFYVAFPEKEMSIK